MHSVRPSWIAAKQAPTTSARPAKACGSAAASTSPTPMMANSSSRTGLLSGSNQLVIQAVYCQASHTANHNSSVSSAPISDRSASSRCDSCVTANT